MRFGTEEYQVLEQLAWGSRWCCLFSRILQEVILMLSTKGQGATLLSLERALFMVGFDVRYPFLVAASPMANGDKPRPC